MNNELKPTESRILGCDGIVTGCSGAILGATIGAIFGVYRLLIFCGMGTPDEDMGSPLTLVILAGVAASLGILLGGLAGWLVGWGIGSMIKRLMKQHSKRI